MDSFKNGQKLHRKKITYLISRRCEIERTKKFNQERNQKYARPADNSGFFRILTDLKNYIFLLIVKKKYFENRKKYIFLLLPGHNFSQYFSKTMMSLYRIVILEVSKITYHEDLKNFDKN